jgi:hypothetical protein
MTNIINLGGYAEPIEEAEAWRYSVIKAVSRRNAYAKLVACVLAEMFNQARFYVDGRLIANPHPVVLAETLNDPVQTIERGLKDIEATGLLVLPQQRSRA